MQTNTNKIFNMKTIYVKGNILYNSQKFRYHPNSGAYMDKSFEDKADEVINGDLVILPTNKDQGSIYTIYWAEGEFAALALWDEYIPMSIQEIRNNFIAEINTLKDLLKIRNRKLNNHTFYRMMIMDIFSAYDFYLSQVLLNQYANNEQAFYQYRMLGKKENKEDEYLRDHIRETIFASKYKELDKIFNTLKITYPYSDEMKNYIHFRHLCVHRQGITKDGNFIELNKDVIVKVMKEVQSGVFKIYQDLTQVEHE